MINSKIEWCDHTVNFWLGCTKVHTGCDNCYAEKLTKRWGNDVWGNDVPRKEVVSSFKTLDNLQKIAISKNDIFTVFVSSLMDIFEKPMPVISTNENSEYKNTGQIRNEFFARITQGRYPNLIFLLLTKRPSNINKYIPDSWKPKPPSNVFFGCSVSNQKTALDLIPQLVKVNGKRFLSIEPQIQSIDLAANFDYYEFINRKMINFLDWVICGGESGHKKRPFSLLWAKQLETQCSIYGVPFFFKQIDKIHQIPEDHFIQQFPRQFQKDDFRIQDKV